MAPGRSEGVDVIDDAPPPPIQAFVVGIITGLALAAAALAIVEAAFR